MAQKWNAGTGKTKVITSKTSQTPPATKTPPAKPFPNNKSGNPNGNKRQAPTVSVS
jgi:hypothetical protein